MPLIPRWLENVILPEHCSVATLLPVDVYSDIFDTKASLRVVMPSLQCVSCISLNAGFDSNKLCIITHLFQAHCVVCQFGIKQAETS